MRTIGQGRSRARKLPSEFEAYPKIGHRKVVAVNMPAVVRPKIGHTIHFVSGVDVESLLRWWWKMGHRKKRRE